MSSTDIFKHVETSHKDLAKPAKHLKTSSAVGWGYDADNFDPDVDGKDKVEWDRTGNLTLTVLKPEERYLLALDNALAKAYGDIVALSYNEEYAQGSIGIKARGRDDILKNVGTVAQKVTIPTTLQKIRRVFSNRGGKEVEEPKAEDVEE